MDEETLVARLLDGDLAAYEHLLRLHGPRLLRAAQRILGNRADAEDALQDALLGAWRSRKTFDRRARFSTWLHRITVNAALAALRRRPATGAPEHGEPVYAPHEARERADWVRRAVDALPEQMRTVLLLRDVEELPSREVAGLLQISDELVRQRLHRARRLLAERLEAELIGDEPLECGGDVELLFDAMDGTLQPELESPVLGHIAGCAACRLMRDGFKRLAAPLRSEDPDPAIDRGAREVSTRVLEQLTRSGA
jgi:RNA polymerase sigma-70 factor (ECF subfamily)